MTKLPPEALEFFKQQGKKGGEKAAESMTPAERRSRAQKAAAKSAAVRSKSAKAKNNRSKKDKVRPPRSY
jgi:hypothetical protein